MGADTIIPFSSMSFKIPPMYDSTRTQHIEGGYCVKNGVCYIDWTFKMLKATTGGSTILANLPMLKNASTSVAFYIHSQSIGGGTYYNRFRVTYSNSVYTMIDDTIAEAVGNTWHICCAYLTTASDT